MGTTTDDGLESLPWPNVRGKRCLGIAAADGPDLVGALRDRGAASADATPAEGAVYDVVVAWHVLDGAPDPAAEVADLRRATGAVLLSCEPLDLWLSVAARGRPLFTLADGVGGTRLGFNGAGHRRLLELGGFAVERVARPFTVPDGRETAGVRAAIEGLVVRTLTGRSSGGRLHRAVLARAVDPPGRCG